MLRACRLAQAGSRFALRILSLWHLTSLDAVTVAVVWLLGFARVTEVTLPRWVPLLVALIVWVVYVADRLLDAWAGLQKAELHSLRERHYFHWRHRAVLMPIALVAVCAAAWMTARLVPTAVRQRDTMLAAAALLYFARVHGIADARSRSSRFYSKEVLVGLLFSCGCAMPSLVRGPVLPLLAPTIFFAALAWLNCFAIDRWESVAVDRGGWPIAKVACVVAAIGLLLAVCLAAMEPRAAAMTTAGAASALLLAGLDRVRGRLDAVALRAAADLALLAPAVLIWVGR